MKTINCRDDSLIEDRGMWTTMKKKKRCIIVAQGFYEWLKKGNQKLPHFTRRKDGQLMCFAGLWDMVQFEGEWPTLPSALHEAGYNEATFFLAAAGDALVTVLQTPEVVLHAVERAFLGSPPACHVFPALCTCSGPH